MRFTRTNPKSDLRIVRGKGSLVYDDAGAEYVDFVCGRGTANIGHCHPAVVRAIAEQSSVLIHYTNEVRLPVQERYVERLGAIVPEFDTVYLANSGAEAVEAAIKLARLATGRAGILSFEGGFHGRTLGALSATWGEKIRGPFSPLVPGFDFCPASIGEVARRISNATAAVLVEPIQGAAGVVPFSASFLADLGALARANGALLVFDECQTGFGRTGRYFAFQRLGIVPDILVASKSMCGGLPAGAMFSSGIDFPEDLHGGTFCGNPLACAAGLAVLDVFEQEGILKQVAEREVLVQQFGEAMGDFDAVEDVRGSGLMIGVQFDTERVRAEDLVLYCRSSGVLINVVKGRVVRLLPALNIPLPLLERGFAAVIDGFRCLSGQRRAVLA